MNRLTVVKTKVSSALVKSWCSQKELGNGVAIRKIIVIAEVLVPATSNPALLTEQLFTLQVARSHTRKLIREGRRQ